MLALMTMAVKKVLKMGHPVLRLEARRLEESEFSTPMLEELLIDMADTMKAEGGIGIAAPQIGESVQVAIIEVPEQSRYEGAAPTARLVIINPVMTVIDPTPQGFWEGCLSVPGLRGFVERPRGIRIEYRSPDGGSHTLEAFDFLATVFQHELDHLFATLYVDRIKDMKRFSFNEEFVHFHQGPGPEVD
jgi:peptide deformylase